MGSSVYSRSSIFIGLYLVCTSLLAFIPFAIEINYLERGYGARNYSVTTYLLMPILISVFNFKGTIKPYISIPLHLLSFAVIGLLMAFLSVLYSFKFSLSRTGNDWIFGVLYYGLYALLQYQASRFLGRLKFGAFFGFWLPIFFGITAFIIMKILSVYLSGTGLDNGAFISDKKWLFYNIYPLPIWQSIIGGFILYSLYSARASGKEADIRK